MNLFKSECIKDPLIYLKNEKQRSFYLNRYLGRITRIQIQDDWNVVLSQQAKLIQKYYRNIDLSIEAPSLNAFLSGSQIGLDVINNCMPAEIKTKMADLNLHDPILATDPSEAEQKIAENILTRGEHGFDDYPEIGTFLDDWARQEIGDIRVQPLLRRGAGYVIHLALLANEQVAREYMIKASRGNYVNWDLELLKFNQQQ